ncbi:MAG: tRNA lysidine(34) synthetase TilS, partial [Spirochaetota bacterium]
MRDVSFTETFEERLASEAKALGLVNIPVVVAVSGGPDSLSLSVSLSRLRTKLGLTMTLVYIDHRLRGPRASRAERRAVARVAHSLRIPLRIVDTGRELSNDDSSGEGIEARARRVRYRELFKVAEERGAKGVCLAHHLNDQVETVLMRLLSGSTVEGLAAMRPVTERAQHTLYRPMLRMERADILEYVRAMSIVPV